MPGLRSLRNRLAVIFALIIVGAIGTIYLSVTPRLEASLTSQHLDQVVFSTRQYTDRIAAYLPPLRRTPMTKDDKPDAPKIKRDLDQNVRRLAESIGTEILLMSVKDAGPYLLTDSAPNGGATASDVQDVTRQALRTKRPVTDIVTTRNGRQALAAQKFVRVEKEATDETEAVESTYVVVFSDSLSDVQDNVALIRRQVLISGGIALVIAILAGYLVARALAARVKRLERAARKV
ncbi:MAG TPA: hypothetical protein VI300_27035, partial [Solirubrobacter sp.]